MARSNRNSSPEIEIHLLREGVEESIHTAHAVVTDTRGRVLSVAGSADHASFIRSALKPFQAMTVTSTGTLDRFKLTDKDLAVICSSHQGTMEQVRQVFNILWRADIDASALQCPVPVGKTNPLEHNCSGKHAGMLAVCQQCSWALMTYLHRSHPVQQLIINQLADILGIPPDEFICAHDDCGAPTYFMQLRQMSTLYAKLSSGDNLEMERIVRAMTAHPEMVSGPTGFDSQLMKLSEGALVSKSGGEGIQCVGRVGQGLGLAIKVVDGSTRAKYAAALHLLMQMGWISVAIADQLAETYSTLSDYKRLDVVGELSFV
jgi:L-asparaginase